jgi:amino acid transporter
VDTAAGAREGLRANAIGLREVLFHNTLKVFGDGYTAGSCKGVSGVIAGSIYTVLAFGGFDGAAPLAKESKNPRKTVQKAVLFSALGIGVCYVFTTYAADVAFGPGKFAAFTISSSAAASWPGMARARYGFFWFFVFLAVVNSTIANANAGVNGASRMSYAIGRIRVTWVAQLCDLDPIGAYQFVTQAVESPLTNVCDTNYTSIAKMPKRCRPSAAYAGVHAHLSSLAASL